MGDNYHKEQYESIPSFFNNSIHETHLEPCYKKYTLFLSKDSNSSILHQLLKNLDLIDFHCHLQKTLDFYCTPKDVVYAKR